MPELVTRRLVKRRLGEIMTTTVISICMSSTGRASRCVIPLILRAFRTCSIATTATGRLQMSPILLVYEKLLGAGFTASFVDYDGDIDLDLYIINDEYMNPIGNVLFRNDGEGCDGWCWTDVSAETGADVVLSGMGIAAADYDNDADIDFYFSNMLNSFSLLRNDSDVFDDQAEAAGIHFGWTDTVGWGTGFFDYDNDGWKDIYLAATGFVQEDIYLPPEGMHFPHPNYLFRNNQDGTFTDVWQGEERPSMGFAYADYDNNGAVDFVVSNWNEPYQLFRNDSAESHNWLTLDLRGGDDINRDAVGTQVLLTTTDGMQQHQAVTCGGSLGAGNDMRLHFGLGNSEVEAVQITWPNGEQVVVDDVQANQILSLMYGEIGNDLSWLMWVALAAVLAALLVVVRKVLGGKNATEQRA